MVPLELGLLEPPKPFAHCHSWAEAKEMEAIDKKMYKIIFFMIIMI